MSVQLEHLRMLRDRVRRGEGARSEVVAQIERDETKAEAIEEEIELLAKVIEVIQAATETRRQELRDRVENLVTRGLRAVFKKDFEFVFNVSLRRDVFGVIPVLRSKFGDRDLETDFEGRAGGIKDVTAFLLRVIVLSLARPKVAPFLVLDESFSHVSTDLLHGVANLLRELNSAVGVQFFLVTHKPELLDAADVIYRAGLVEGRTQFTLEHDMRDESFHRPPRRGEKARPRGAFDDADLVVPVNEAVATVSETEDVLARRQRVQAARKPDGWRKKKKKS